MSGNRPWTREEDGYLARMHLAGCSDELISEAISTARCIRSPRAVKDRRRRLGLIKDTYRRKWTDKETKLATQLYLQGKTAKQIARNIGRTDNAVVFKLQRIKERLNRQEGKV